MLPSAGFSEAGSLSADGASASALEASAAGAASAFVGISRMAAVSGALSNGAEAVAGAVAVSAAMSAVVSVSMLGGRGAKSGDVMSETVFAPRRETKKD